MEAVKEYVKAEFVPDDNDYHVVGRVYEFYRDFDNGGEIEALDGSRDYICLHCCAHLNGRDWTLCSADGTPL